MNNQWQHNLRDRMEHHEEPAPDGLWDRIEQRMGVESIRSNSVKRSIPWWSLRIAAAAAVALIVLYIGMHLQPRKENHEEIRLSAQQKEQPTPDMLLATKEPATTMKELLPPQRTEKRKAVRKVVRPVNSDKDVTMVVAMDATGNSSAENEQQLNDKPDRQEEAVNRHQTDPHSQRPVMETTETPSFTLPEKSRYRKPARWQTALYASNIPSGTTHQHHGYDSFKASDFPSADEEYVVAAIRSDLPEGVSLLKEYQHVYSDIKHLQPVTLGVSVKYDLDERWSLTGGLTYTLLSSKLRSGSNHHYYNSRQTLHFIGIPLHLNYTVWGNDKIITYLSGGGTAEKNVSGTLSTDFVIDNKLETQSRDKISIDPLQWSVNAAAGIQYQLGKNIGIYAEPGIAYYFKNSSPIETIYKQNPLIFNLNMGLRFSLNK